MSGSIEFKVGDGARPVFARLRDRLGGRVVHEAIGAAMLDCVRSHFDRRAQEPNKLNGPKTGFWAKLSSGSHVSATETDATVTVPAPILQKLYGGDIRPVNAKALAFPVSPNSYGKTAREMRLSGRTKFVPLNRGNVVGIITTIESKGVIGEVLFLVVRKVSQKADPNAVPSEDTLAKAALDAVTAVADETLN
jgi:hypothetical protein